MKRNEVICKIIIKSGLAKSYPDALSLFVQAFVENFRTRSLDHWDTDVPPELAEKFIDGAEEANYDNLHILINDLDVFLKKSKLSLILLAAWHALSVIR
jgi:hypothetical protein